MSALLRTSCQQALDEAGLQAYHIDIQTYQHNIVLVTACGKSVFTFNGLRATKPSPNAAEVKALAQLVTEFLGEHFTEIQRYKKAKATLVAQPLSSVEYPDYTFGSDTAKGKLQATVKFYTAEEQLQYSYPTKKYNYSTNTAVPLATIGKLAADSDVIADMLIAAKHHMVYLKLEKKVEDAVSVLTSCTL